jgi:hypothetical protein
MFPEIVAVIVETSPSHSTSHGAEIFRQLRRPPIPASKPAIALLTGQAHDKLPASGAGEVKAGYLLRGTRSERRMNSSGTHSQLRGDDRVC